MKRLLFLLMFMLSASTVFAVAGDIANPQLKMIGARGISLGGTPVLTNDVSNTILNPAAVADIQKYPFTISSQKLLNTFSYITLNSGFYRKFKYEEGQKAKSFGLSVSFASLSLGDIPESEVFNGEGYQTGSYSGGFNMLHLAAGTSFYDMFSFDKVSLGTGVKYFQQYISDSSGSTFAFDVGALADYYYGNPYVNSVSFGVAAHNIISPSLSLSKTGNESVLPLTSSIGARADMFQDTLSIFASNNSDLGISVGAEYLMQDNLTLRGSTNFDEINMGAGVLLDNISTGIPNYNIKLRIDLSYTQSVVPVDISSDTFAFSISSLGRSAPIKPQIMYPDNLVTSIAEPTIKLSGLGPKNTTVRVFSNDVFIGTALSNKKGQWTIKQLPVFEGENQIVVQSYDIKKDAASISNMVTVISDTQAPELDLMIYPDDNNLKLEVSSNEPLDTISADIGDSRVRFTRVAIPEDEMPESNLDKDRVMKAERYIATLPLPENLLPGAPTPELMSTFQVLGTDRSGNTYESEKIPFFGTVKFPRDRHVHYNDNVLVIGDASDMISSIYINENIVYIDDKKRFSIPVDLKPGKNVVKTSFETLNGKQIDFNTRVLRLVSYDDMNPKVKGRREIEFLSTLGVLYGEDDGNFYPTDFVTREYITKIIVLALDEYVEETVTEDLFNDVPKEHPYAAYIQAGISSGVVFAYPDGSFRPDRAMTLSEAIYMLSNAGVIAFEEVEESDQFVTRAELAEFLAYTPKYERRIESLIDWERGYEGK